MLKVNDKVKVYMYNTCNREIKTWNYGTCKDKCSNKSCCYSCKDDVIDRSDAIDIVEGGGIDDK